MNCNEIGNSQLVYIYLSSAIECLLGTLPIEQKGWKRIYWYLCRIKRLENNCHNLWLLAQLD